MRVLVAYDGSAYSDAAIADLGRAGLPRRSEILVAFAVDAAAVAPVAPKFDLFSLATRRAEAVLSRFKMSRRQQFDEALLATLKTIQRLRSRFPEWRVDGDVLDGKPVEELLAKASVWKPDLIVAGSQGRSAVGRFFLGSVSRKLAEEAACAVRVVRGEVRGAARRPLKILAGASSLSEAGTVLEALERRAWDEGTKLRLVAVDDGVTPGRVSAHYSQATDIFEQLTEPLARFGLETDVRVASGSPAKVLLEAAEHWDADAIFAAGAADESRLSDAAQELLSTALCPVEIAR